jgi:hypothetical protein
MCPGVKEAAAAPGRGSASGGGSGGGGGGGSGSGSVHYGQTASGSKGTTAADNSSSPSAGVELCQVAQARLSLVIAALERLPAMFSTGGLSSGWKGEESSNSHPETRPYILTLHLVT